MSKTSVPLLREFRARLGPEIESLGLTEQARDGRSNLIHTWRREDGLQLDLLRYHQPWLVPVLGNTFTIGLSHLGSTIIDQADGRIWYLIDDPEWAKMRSIHEAVLASLPDPDTVPELFETERLGAREFMERLARPWMRNHEVWFRYRNTENLLAWFEFLKPLVPRVLSRYCAPRGIPFQHV